MSYCTQAQLEARFGTAMLTRLTDRFDVPTNVVDTIVLGRALADADAMIDGYLAGRYALPLAATPALIADIAQVIVVWKLHVTEPEAKVKADYDDAVRRLREISQGVIQLVDMAGTEPAAKSGSGVQITDRERPFTEDNMKGFI